MKKFLIFTFSLNTAAELLLGAAMIFSTSLFSRLVFVAEPQLFIRMIGFFALCLGLLSGLAVYRIMKGKLSASLFDIVLFFFSLHTVLAIVLGIAALDGLMSWLGFFVHWPLAILFGVSIGVRPLIKR